MWKKMLPWLSIMALLLAACGPAATATPQPTATPRSVATAVPTIAPTAVAGPTAAPTPGAKATPVTAPTATPKPQPTAAPATGIKTGGTLRMANDPREPRGWDRWAWKSGARDVSIRAYLNFNQLVTYATSLEVPCQLGVRAELAESWKWVNDRTLEMKLRQGVKFQNKPPINGREMTADDVVWSATRFIKEDTIRGLEQIAPHVEKIEKIDKYGVRFVLDGPMPSFLTEGLTSEYGSLILPQEVVDEKGRWTDPAKSYIGTGPWAFKEHVPGVRSSFVKNPGYFKKGLPYMDGVDLLIVPEISTQVATLRSGALDIIFDVPVAMALALKAARGIATPSCPQLGIIPGRFYFRVDQKPFNDVRVRRAVQMAIDREGIVKSILQGQGVTAPHYPVQIYKGNAGWDELPPEVAQWVKFDPQRARQLLAEAGYPTGLEMGLKFSTGYTTPYPEIAEAVTGMLQQVGFKVKPRYVSSIEWAHFSNTGDFGDDQLTFGLISSLYVPTSQFSTWHSQGPISANRSGINDPEVDKLVEEILVQTDQNRADQLYKKLSLRLIDQAWEPNSGAFPMLFGALRDYVKDWAGGYQYFSAGYTEGLWLDK
ncbi:MAG: hypothetical protein HYY01_03015 [Chloroflexi bacterium]|nr:hypothetical protein [Chloroflexota bacterium]